LPELEISVDRLVIEPPLGCGTPFVTYWIERASTNLQLKNRVELFGPEESIELSESVYNLIPAI